MMGKGGRLCHCVSWRGGGKLNGANSNDTKKVQSSLPFFFFWPGDKRRVNWITVIISWIRSSRVVRASGFQCNSRNSPGFGPSILRHSGIWVAEDVAGLNKVHKNNKNPRIPPAVAYIVEHSQHVHMHSKYNKYFQQYLYFTVNIKTVHQLCWHLLYLYCTSVDQLVP